MPDFTQIADENFWHRLVPQLSHSDPIIWDAVIALSCLIQHFQSSGEFVKPGSKADPIVNEEHRRALTWYGKSIARLRTRLKQATTRSTTAVISCILYICIECLQDNCSGALSLYQRAVAMMEMAPEPDRAICPTTSASERSLQRSVRALLQNMSVSQRLPIERERFLGQMTFETLSDARAELYVLPFAAHDFIVDTIEIRINQPKDWTPSSVLISRQQHLQTRFRKWHSALEHMTQSSGRFFTRNEMEAYSFLHVAYGHYFILLVTGLSMYETDFHTFFPMFQAMVDHASRIVASRRAELRPVFMFETRVIPSLFAVAIKCRHPMIHRQAISLLRMGTQIENTWRADAMANIAEWTVGIEESGNIHGIFCAEPSQVELLPENYRVHWDQVVELRGPDGRPAKFHQFQMWQQDENHAWSLVEHTVQI
ncbi:uncharacterized protein A1O5_10336 [Cladophialophora psammophila CBS 110553]|uniref:Transcription factor domain-containing protein n=1 Tax=Cladophialophora psammophila CBS 110553 TaxID=1182543 RepID=W9WNT6_9EURO|nr:uncharacterized protein A1O5_10336 [Cladophialophora psammophila CBS 110553]EXJ66665.1 hypothetical protein A1O5_10336 [Cladophialophora psammophila CBS 110553]